MHSEAHVDSDDVLKMVSFVSNFTAEDVKIHMSKLAQLITPHQALIDAYLSVRHSIYAAEYMIMASERLLKVSDD